MINMGMPGEVAGKENVVLLPALRPHHNAEHRRCLFRLPTGSLHPMESLKSTPDVRCGEGSLPIKTLSTLHELTGFALV